MSRGAKSGAKPLFADEGEARAFSKQLATLAVAKQLEFHASADSTNELAGQAARAGAPHGLTVVADHQTAGRGRRGRTWASPPARGLLFSVLLRYRGLPPERIGWIALGAGVACAEALERTAGVPATVKWPNDVVVAGRDGGAGAAPWRKLGGILCEGAAPKEPGGDGYVVVGIGLNLLHTREELPVVPKSPPTSVFLETGNKADRRAVLAEALQRLERAFRELQSDEGFAALRARAIERLESWWNGRRIVARGAEGEVEGVFRTLDPFGRLVLAEDGGRTVALSDAEITGVR
ncbi:MAG: biotin--[acetyl-CoA-carboxylase] ligase [Planctomycetota bacterium]|nr:biotin--[acetyl-CoA-carboxylase] ligase [Planctomycetota bacterium]